MINQTETKQRNQSYLNDADGLRSIELKQQREERNWIAESREYNMNVSLRESMPCVLFALNIHNIILYLTISLINNII